MNQSESRAPLEHRGLTMTVAALALCAATSAQAQTDPPLALPDPLKTSGGLTVSDRSQWSPRREEILELFRSHVHGRTLGAPSRVSFSLAASDPRAMGGAATLKQVDVRVDNGERSLVFRVTLFVPNHRRGPSPVFLLANNRPPENTDPTRQVKSDFWPAEQVIARGYAIAAYQVNEVDPDHDDGFKNGLHAVLEPEGANRPDDAWGTIGAWAWAASRVVDYFETDRDLDARKVALVGHSRGGKTALWAGAQDTRIAITISNDSGRGGAALSRRRVGETVDRLTSKFPHWFSRRFRTYANREDELPVDQHMLMALIAPRALYVASAQEDEWADPRGEYLSLHHAGAVFALWGHPTLPLASPPVSQPVYAGPTGYHMRPGKHNLTAYDWQRFMDFADRVYAASATPRPTSTGCGGCGQAGGLAIAFPLLLAWRRRRR